MAESEPQVRTYVSVYVALLALLAATTGLAYLDLGGWSVAVALGIAGTKALLVLAYFMHLRGAGGRMWLAAGMGFYWLAILLAGTLSDLLTRPWLAPLLPGRP